MLNMQMQSDIKILIMTEYVIIVKHNYVTTLVIKRE
jgi:hypothetical protein